MLLVADEVQTGLGRSGSVWAIERFGVEPDVLVTGKGLSGGMYPMSAALLSDRAGAWLAEDGWGYVTTFGGSDLGCEVARTALALSTAPATLERVARTSERFAAGFDRIAADHPFLVEVRRCGVIMALRFDDRMGALTMARALYEQGVWAMFAGFDASTMQWKPGLLVDDDWIDETLDRFERAITGVEAPADDGGAAMTDAFYELQSAEQVAALAALAASPRCPTFGLPADATLEVVTERENAVFRVDVGDERVAVRVHRAGYHDDDELRSHAMWAEALTAAGVVATAPVVRTLDGRRRGPRPPRVGARGAPGDGAALGRRDDALRVDRP